MSNLKNTLPGIPRKRNRLDIDTFARMSGRPDTPPFQVWGGRRYITPSLGREYLVNFSPVVSNGL